MTNDNPTPATEYDAIREAKEQAYDEACEHDVAVCRDGRSYNPYRVIPPGEGA